MSAESIPARLAEYERMPEGRAKSQRIESLAEEAKRSGDHRVEADVLIALSQAYEYNLERERMPAVFGRLLQLLDRFPGEVGALSKTILWQLKWMTVGLMWNPAVPLETDYRWLDELGTRYRQGGYSLRPVHALRSGLALNLGDHVTATAEMEASIAAPRDEMSDCQACERNDWGDWRVRLGDDAGALGYWRQVLDGRLRCREEPHRVLAKALLPLLRTGRVDDARGAFLRGYPLVRHNVSLRANVGEHIEFCALTGNEARGLEILAEHTAWLTDTQVDATARLRFIAGVCLLLRRLTALGHGALPAGPATVAAMLPVLQEEISDLCGRYDSRNGNTAVSDRVAVQLAQEPVLGRLPLGYPARLPQLNAPAPVPQAGMPGAVAQPGMPVSPGTLDELVAEARRLSDARHPDSTAAWNKVAASGADLHGDVAARVARAKAAGLMPSDPATACAALLDAAGQFASLGDTSRALEARARAAVARAMAGDQAAASAAAAAVAAEAETALSEGKISARLYLATRAALPEIALAAMGTTGQRVPAAIAAAAELAGSELALAQRLGEVSYAAAFQEMLGQMAAWQNDLGKLAECLNAARSLYLEAGEPWNAAKPEAFLAHLVYQRRDPRAAEELARAALEHGGGLRKPEEEAQLSSLLAEAIGAQPGRDLDYAGASLTAAARWQGISEPDTLHSTFNAARAYARLGRHGEAAALFAEVMPRADIPYEPAVIAMTRGQYAASLRILGRHREAAEQFLEAARLVQDDPDNATAHARLARSAADELERSGQVPEAIAAYQRAAELLGGLGEVAERVRSLRSAAWLHFWEQETDAAGTGDGQAGVTAMRAVLSELEAVTASGPSDELTAELTATRKQLGDMLSNQ